MIRKRSKTLKTYLNAVNCNLTKLTTKISWYNVHLASGIHMVFQAQRVY